MSTVSGQKCAVVNLIVIGAAIYVSIFFSFSATAIPITNPVTTSLSNQGEQVLLARIQLQAYRNELEKNGISQKMGLGRVLGSEELSHYNGYITYFELSLREMAVNTLSFGRLLFTNKETRLLREWREQISELDHTLAALNVVYRLMADRGVSVQGAFAIVNSEPRFQPIRSWCDQLAQSAWALAVMNREKLPMRPLQPGDFGLNFTTNFVNEDWRALLAGQVSIANVYIFWRGAEMVSIFGKSGLGIKIAEHLRLSKLIEGINLLPPVMQKPALWILYETADGCTIRYFQTAYIGFHEANWQSLKRVTTQS